MNINTMQLNTQSKYTIAITVDCDGMDCIAALTTATYHQLIRAIEIIDVIKDIGGDDNNWDYERWDVYAEILTEEDIEFFDGLMTMIPEEDIYTINSFKFAPEIRWEPVMGTALI